VPFALPKKYSHRRLHEYKLNFEFIMRIFSNRADATRILLPSLPVFYHILLNHLPLFIASLLFPSKKNTLNERKQLRFFNSSQSNMTTELCQALRGLTLTLSCSSIARKTLLLLKPQSLQLLSAESSLCEKHVKQFPSDQAAWQAWL